MSIDQTFGLKSIQRLKILVDKESKRYGLQQYKIYLDMAFLYLRYGVGPNYYLLAGFANPNTTKEQKRGHLSTRQFYATLDQLNLPAYRKITQNKISEKAFLKLLGAPISEFIGYFDKKSGFISNASVPLTNISQLNDLLGKHINAFFCFKLVEGWGGKGFIAGVVEIRKDTPALKRLFSERYYTSEDIINHFKKHNSKGDFLVERYIEQHSSYSLFNETSLNTIRVWTLIHQNGLCKVIGAYLRVGRRGSLTDNGDGGGIMCPIDIKTGIVGPGVLSDQPLREELYAHPDTGYQLAEQELKDWNLIKDLCVETLPKIPFTRFAGFDIAMSTKGPVIVEVNVSPDRNGAANGKFVSKVLRDNI